MWWNENNNNNMEANYKGILEDFRSPTPLRKFKRGGKKEKQGKALKTPWS